MFFAVQRVITAFLLPPGLFVFLLLAAGLLLYRRRRRAALLLVFLGLLIWLTSIAPVADRIIAPLEQDALARSTQSTDADLIVLLGGGLYDGVPDLTGLGAPSEDMLTRIVCLLRVYRKLDLPVLVAGGAPPEFATPEAVVVGRFLRELGIPAERVLLEDQSRDTLENAVNVAAICKERGFRKPLVVTSAYHARRARLAFARAGLTVTVVPANFRSGVQRHYGWAALLPAAEPIETIWRAGREYIGLTYYRWVLGLKSKESN